MKYIVISFLIIFFLQSCKSSREISGHLTDVYSVSENDFIAIHKTSTFSSIVRIDSSGEIHTIRKLDSLLSTTLLSLVNDSILLLRSSFSNINPYPNNSKFICYNLNSNKITDSFPAVQFRFVSNDRNLLVVNFRENSAKYARTTNVYRLVSNNVLKIASLSSPGHILRNFGENQFLIRMEDTLRIKNLRIANADLTVSDTLPTSYYSISGSEPVIYYFRPVCESETSYQYDTVLTKYDLKIKKFDTLFLGPARFEGPIYRLDPENYLFKFLKKEENDEGWREIYKSLEGAWCGTTSRTPECYWVIGNNLNKEIKKIGFSRFDALISSSRRHILFYKQDGDSFNFKVISTKELEK